MNKLYPLAMPRCNGPKQGPTVAPQALTRGFDTQLTTCTAHGNHLLITMTHCKPLQLPATRVDTLNESPLVGLLGYSSLKGHYSAQHVAYFPLTWP